MSRTILFQPIVDKEVEKMFLLVVSKKFKVDHDVLSGMSHYFSSDNLRPDKKFDLYYVLNILSGQDVKFPTVDKLYRVLRDVSVYLEVKALEKRFDDFKKNNKKDIQQFKAYPRYDEIISETGLKYKITPAEVHNICNDYDYLLEAEKKFDGQPINE